MGSLCGGVEERSDVSGHVNISVAEFISVCIFLSEECGKIIREVEESGQLAIFQKAKDTSSPVTEADLRVQKTLEVNLRAIYPTLRLHGEESKESIADKKSAVDPSQVTSEIKNFVTKDFLN